MTALSVVEASKATLSVSFSALTFSRDCVAAGCWACHARRATGSARKDWYRRVCADAEGQEIYRSCCEAQALREEANAMLGTITKSKSAGR